MALTNSQMTKNRWLRYHEAREKVRFIRENLLAGRHVYIFTSMCLWKFSTCHADIFKAGRNGAYMRRGKALECIDGAAIRVV